MPISSIIIEALARRAKTLVDSSVPGAEYTYTPDVADFRAAFEDELKRFSNNTGNGGDAGTDTTVLALAPPKSPSQRAKLIPEHQPSLGRGPGQSTGGTAASDGQEARKLLEMITPCGMTAVAEVCGANAANFVAEQADRANAIVTHFSVTGRQLFWLRDIKNQLVERGIL